MEAGEGPLDLTTRLPIILPTHLSEYEKFLEHRLNYEQKDQGEKNSMDTSSESESELESETDMETAPEKKFIKEIKSKQIKKKKEGETEQSQMENLKFKEWWENINLYRYISKEGLPKDLKVFPRTFSEP